jgi:hypothetical protein
MIVECGSNPIDESSILVDKYFSKRHKKTKESYIWINCIHTIERWKLNNKSRVKGIPNLSNQIKQEILIFLREMVN